MVLSKRAEGPSDFLEADNGHGLVNDNLNLQCWGL